MLWTVLEILAVIFLFASLVTFFFALVTGENWLVVAFVICLMICIFAGVFPDGVVSETSYEVNAQVTHMDQTKDKYNRTNNMSFATEDGKIAGVLSVSDYDYAVYQVGDEVIVEVTDYTRRNGRTGQSFELIQNYN